MVKIHFLMVLPFGLFWSVKYLNFEGKLLIRTANHIFLESGQPEVTNIYTMFCPLRGAKKKVSAY